MEESEGKPSLLQQYKQAKARGDEQTAAEVLREVNARGEVRRAQERADAARDERRDFGRELKEARLRGYAPAAEALIMRALKRERVPTLDPDDMIWVVRQLGAWHSSWRTGHAIAAWMFHHGPVHRGLFQAAEEIAALNNAEWLDDVLLWSEPTPKRWVEEARWAFARTWCDLSTFCQQRSLQKPDDLSTPDNRAVFTQCVREWGTDFARRVVAERGEAARRSLRAASKGSDDEELRLVLETWIAELAAP